MSHSPESYARWYAKNRDHIRALKAANMRRYRAEDPEKHRQQSRDHKAKTRTRLLAMYGSTCALCGFGDARALTLDHVKRNGGAERRSLGERGVYRRARADSSQAGRAACGSTAAAGGPLMGLKARKRVNGARLSKLLEDAAIEIAAVLDGETSKRVVRRDDGSTTLGIEFRTKARG